MKRTQIARDIRDWIYDGVEVSSEQVKKNPKAVIAEIAFDGDAPKELGKLDEKVASQMAQTLVALAAPAQQCVRSFKKRYRDLFASTIWIHAEHMTAIVVHGLNEGQLGSVNQEACDAAIDALNKANAELADAYGRYADCVVRNSLPSDGSAGNPAQACSAEKSNLDVAVNQVALATRDVELNCK